MRKLFLFVMAAMWAASMWAVPVRPGLYRMEKQPDGTEVKVFIHGDEWFNYETDSLDNVFERDTKGHLKRDARGFLINTHKKMTDEYAQQQWQTARRKMQEQNGPRKNSGFGTPTEIPRILVILVEFPDKPFQDGNRDKNEWHYFFNKPGYNYDGATGSVYDYFLDQSNNKYKPLFDVVGPITAPHEWEYYDYSKQKTNEHAQEIVPYLCEQVDKEVDFSKYDADNDGYIDLVAYIFAGPAYCIDHIGIWPHGAYVDNGVLYDGKKLQNYCCASELYESKRCGIGVFCHEFSHMLGFPDYYTIGTLEPYYRDNYYTTPANWSIMGNGNYLNDAKTPPNYSIFDKYFMGWDTPKGVLKLGDNIEIEPSQPGYMVTKDGEMKPYNSSAKIYYVENRQKTGWDKYAPGHGLLIWEIRYDQFDWLTNVVNTNGRGVMCVPSNGRYLNFIFTFPGPENNTSQLLHSKYNLQDIKEDSNGKVSFTVTSLSLTAKPKYDYLSSNVFFISPPLYSAVPYAFNSGSGEELELMVDAYGDEDTDFELQCATHFVLDESEPKFRGYKWFSATQKQMQKSYQWETEEIIAPDIHTDYILFRVKATTTIDGKQKEFYSNTLTIKINYKLMYNIVNTKFNKDKNLFVTAGTRVAEYIRGVTPCHYIKIISCTEPVDAKIEGDSLIFTMPACPLELDVDKAIYNIYEYYDWDGRYLFWVQAPCGEEPVAEYNPTRAGYTFSGWSEPVSVNEYGYKHAIYAQYIKTEGRDTYDMELVSHETEDYPYYNYIKEQNPFKGNSSMAMVRDRLTFRLKHTANDAGTVYFCWTTDFDGNGDPVWHSSYPDIYSMSIEEAMADKEVLYTYEICNAPGCADEKTYASRMAYKFRYVTKNSIYDTSPIFFDIYYPQFIKAKASDGLEISVKPKGYKFEYPTLPNDGEKVGDYIYTMVPAQYGDTVYLYGSDYYNTEDCLNFNRLRFKTWPSVATDISEDGTIYYTVEGFTDTIQITKAVYEVHFKYRKSDGEGSYYPYDDVQYVPCGSSASMPTLEDINYDPEMHPFIEWLCENKPDDRRWMNVHEELYYDAYYDYKPGPVYYTVTFVDWKGDVIGEPQKVLEYDDAVAPEPPTREGFHFTHWDKSFTNVQTDKTVTALYGQDGVTWTVTYRDYNDDLLGTETVPDGGDAVADVFVYRTGHKFRAWDAILTDIHNDIIANAQYEKVDIPLHKVTIIAEGGKVEVFPKQVELDQVNDGTTLTLTAVPDEYHEFKGWEGYSPIFGLVVMEDLTVTANFTLTTYTIIFVDWDGTELKKETVEHGGDAKGPDTNPTREGYTFTGWSKPITNITGDLIVIAQYEKSGTGVENTEYRIQNTDKILRDGHLYILVNDRIYDATGRLVK